MRWGAPMRLALALLLFAAPLQAQTVEISSGLWFAGPLISEPEHRVRLGNMGQEQSFVVRLAGPVAGDWDAWGELLLVPTHLYVYPSSEPGGWMARPVGATAQEPVTWSCLTVGMARMAGWLEASAGLGMCNISGARYGYFGAAPLHVGTGQMSIAARKSVGDALNLGVRCRAWPTHVGPESLTVLRIASGEHPDVRTSWMWSASCGVSIGMGGDR